MILLFSVPAAAAQFPPPPCYNEKITSPAIPNDKPSIVFLHARFVVGLGIRYRAGEKIITIKPFYYGGDTELGSFINRAYGGDCDAIVPVVLFPESDSPSNTKFYAISLHSHSQ